ncbi:retrovirus-related pol polyprotein from transposon TNT 1-94 [Tanacetum coccineum]
MSKSFKALQQHAINLELALQHCQEQIKNDKAFKENQSTLLQKEREQYFKIQYLKAQLQEKGIAISELKKLIEKLIGKYVETKFEKPSVIRQPNAFKSQRQLILGTPTTFSDSFAKKDFSKSKSVTKNDMSNDFSNPVTAQFLPDNGNITIKRVYYVEGLNHNLFSVGQFCDADLEVAFRKSTCYVRDLKGNDLLTGSRGTDLYSITLQDTSTLNPICLMAKASSSQDWLWHRRLSHLNFDSINLLSKNDIVIGLPKLKFIKDHLCSSCELAKAKRKYTWTHFLRSKDETPEVLIISLDLSKEDFMLKRNRTLVEAARTMLSAAKVPLFFWVEAITTTCFTQNRSLVIPRREKTPYHIINGQKPFVKFFHIFGSLCYIVKDGENLDKIKEKGDACIFVGYSTQSRAYRVYNKRTKVIVETIHVNFDELPHMASDHVSSDPVPQSPTPILEQDSLSPEPQSQENVPQAAKTVTTSNELDLLFSSMFDELLNGTTPVVSKSSAVNAADAPDKCQQQITTQSSTTTVAADIPPLNIQTIHETTTQAPTVTATENINQAESNKENAQVEEDEFFNIFSTPVQERGETSSRHVDSSNMYTFYQ